MGYFHIGDEYKNLISKIFQYGIMDGDLHLTHCDNRQLGSTKIVDKYLAEKNIYVYDRLFNFEKPIKTLANTENKISF